MTEHSSTRVEGAQGPMHTGSGNIYVTMGAGAQDTDRPSFRRIADDQLAWLRRVLVAPDNMGEARAKLADTGTVILDGTPGSGRTSTARVLLREYHQDTGVLHELLPGEEGELPLTDPDLVGAGDRLLLDLSATDPGRWAAAQADLPALRKAVHEQQAHLVVVMVNGGVLDPDLQHYRVVIGRPRGDRVFRRHLRTNGLAAEEYLQAVPAVDEFLKQRSMREIADFADLVRRAREAARSDDTFAEWCASALRARADRRKDVASLVAQLRDSPQRALLITVAMLHGAHADVIHDTSQLLLSTAGSPPDELPLLQHKDLAERLAEISADAGPTGHVRFTELDYDSAVRTHFWDHMPALRHHLGTWTARSVEMNGPHVTRTLRDRLVGQLAGQYLRTGRVEGLATLAEKWSSADTSQVRREATVQALTCGLEDPAYGKFFRGRIYQWCVQKQLKSDFARVLIQVCADVVAASHPDQAMLRLYYLACHQGDTAPSARQALRGLVATSHRLRRRLFARLALHGVSQPELEVFLGICDPEPLTDLYDNARALVDENGVQASLTTCWQAVLNGLPHKAWQPHAARWLHAATATGRRGNILLDLLVEAADRCDGRRGATFAALYASARDAERTDPFGLARAEVTTDLLLQKISAAQGLGPPTTPPHAASARGNEP
ncbi:MULTISPECIES: hypothetical protein [Streptomyces]|uniref:ATP-binding protein n=1 Tax=Streptomyces salyersiae TaxID=3075530 RepID=A0ABU2RMY6_9ACTN|nr:hypothetical protein [Streptomyces sp. DSM 41770]MDT0429648.1 hypothetical protein [Streptomyces sp. DSM 41770]